MICNHKKRGGRLLGAVRLLRRVQYFAELIDGYVFQFLAIAAKNIPKRLIISSESDNMSELDNISVHLKSDEKSLPCQSRLPEQILKRIYKVR